jgi:hypothetical protein
MALSSTEATPLTISGGDEHRVVAAQGAAGDRREARAGGVEALRVGHRVELLGTDVAPCLAQGVRLRLAAALGHRFGKVGEEHGEPQPQRDSEDETRRCLAMAAERLEVQDRRDDTADQHDEHHGVLELVPRVEFQQRGNDGAAHDLGIEQRPGFRLSRHDWLPGITHAS